MRLFRKVVFPIQCLEAGDKMVYKQAGLYRKVPLAMVNGVNTCVKIGCRRIIRIEHCGQPTRGEFIFN